MMSSVVSYDGGIVTPLRLALEAHRHDLVNWMCESGVMTDVVFEQVGQDQHRKDSECEVIAYSPIESALSIATFAFMDKQLQVEYKTNRFICSCSHLGALVAGMLRRRVPASILGCNLHYLVT